MDKQHEQLLAEKLERAGAIEQMVNTKGWEYLRSFIEAKIKSFATEAITEGFSNMEDFNLKRGEVFGLRNIIGEIDDHLQTLYDYRQKQSAGSTTK